MGQEAQLDLGIVSREKHGARRSDEGAANGLAARGTHGDVLQVRVGGRQPSRGGTGLIKARMDASAPRPDASIRALLRPGRLVSPLGALPQDTGLAGGPR